MTMTEDLDLTAGAETTAAEEARGISLLREAERRRAKATDDLFLDVPSWNGDLIAQYRVVDRQRMEGLVRKIMQEAKGGNNSNARTAADIDLILEASIGMYAYDPEGGPEPEDRRAALEDDMGTVGWTRFGEILKRIRPTDDDGRAVTEFRSAREIVLWATKNNAVAISAHALTIARWMRDPSKPVTTEDLA